MIRGFSVLSRIRQAAAVLAMMPVVATFGTVFVGWLVLARVAEAKRGGR